MAIYTIAECKNYWDGRDLSGDHDSVAVNFEAAELPSTNFSSSGWYNCRAGLRSASFDVGGLQNIQTNYEPDDIMFDSIGGTPPVYTWCPTTGAQGEVGFFCEPYSISYVPQTGAVGELAKFNLSVKASGKVARGRVLFVGTETSDDTSTANQITVGAVTSGQHLVGACHCTALSADDTLDISIQDENDDTRLTFTQFSAVGAEIQADGTAGTETDYYVTWDLTGTDTSATFIVVLAVVD